jgi:tyrosine-specific transport protein
LKAPSFAARTARNHAVSKSAGLPSAFGANSASEHRRPRSHAQSSSAPHSQRLRLAAAPDAEPEAAATDGGVFGAAALVAGNMVGGGILAIPTVCAEPGFYPAAALTICLWAANVGTGLLLGEVAAAAVRRGDEDVSLRALSCGALGESGAQLTSAFFVGTNLLLMGAYVAAGLTQRP